uniref:Uncharacterized protein n=1 Tax=Arundo donax TaxID=35708 RepID=A0A0A8Z5H1_ARUDO
MHWCTQVYVARHGACHECVAIYTTHACKNTHTQTNTPSFLHSSAVASFSIALLELLCPAVPTSNSSRN